MSYADVVKQVNDEYQKLTASKKKSYEATIKKEKAKFEKEHMKYMETNADLLEQEKKIKKNYKKLMQDPLKAVRNLDDKVMASSSKKKMGKGKKGRKSQN